MPFLTALLRTIFSVLTTAGDLAVRDATTVVRLGIGNALQHLRVNAGGTALEYADPPTADNLGNHTATQDLAMAGFDITNAGLKINETLTELTISVGVITVVSPIHRVDTEGDAATDNLDDINLPLGAELIVLLSAVDERDPTLIDGNPLGLSGNFTLDGNADTITFYGIATTSAIEVSRSNNE